MSAAVAFAYDPDMAGFVLTAWDAAGGLLPFLGLARRLGERGHDVRLLGNPSIGRRYQSQGWRFRPFAETPDYDVTAPKVDVSTEKKDVNVPKVGVYTEKETMTVPKVTVTPAKDVDDNKTKK